MSIDEIITKIEAETGLKVRRTSDTTLYLMTPMGDHTLVTVDLVEGVCGWMLGRVRVLSTETIPLLYQITLKPTSN